MAHLKNYLQEIPEYNFTSKDFDSGAPKSYRHLKDVILHYPYEVFVEWFNYWRLSGNYVVKVGKKRINFKLDEFNNAHEFLLKHGSLLFFADQLNPMPVKAIQKAGVGRSTNSLYISVDLGSDYDKIVESFKKLLNKRKTGLVPSWKTSTAELKPSVGPKHIKIEALRRMRQVYTFQKQGLNRRLVAEKMGWIDEDIIEQRSKEGMKDDLVIVLYEAAYRKVSRHRARAEKILKNVAKGQFP